MLLESGLTKPILKQVWTLSDVDQDGALTQDEFLIAMSLVDFVQHGHALPDALPATLIPKGK